MTPKAKAEELISKFQIRVSIAEDSESIIESGKILKRSAVKCAIIAVEEILELNIVWYDTECVEFDHKVRPEQTMEFWEEVLTELKAMQ